MSDALLTVGMVPSSLRILSYNIHAGVGLDGRLDLERLAGVINRAQPDLVALQEVDRGTRRSQGLDQVAVLSELTGMRGVFCKAMDHDGGEYGQAILSRWPWQTVETHFLPTVPDEEPRTATAMRLNLGGEWPEVVFIATHLSWKPVTSIHVQALRLNELFAVEGNDYRILAGDMNAVPSALPIQELKKCWQGENEEEAGATFPADEPILKIDHVMVAPRLKLISTEVIDEPVASDHRPVLSVIGLAEN